MKTFVGVAGAPGRPCQDRAVIQERDGELLCILADGVGGQAGGAEAAEQAIESLSQPPYDFTELDQTMRVGLTTAVLARVTAQEIRGASVGDSCAWLLLDGLCTDLTAHQRRKPYLGSGTAIAIPFVHPTVHGATLLLASDGLWRHAQEARILALATQPDLQQAGRELLDAPRLRISGDLPDDVSVILIRF